MFAQRAAPDTPGSSGIVCRDCKARVPLALLPEHTCSPVRQQTFSREQRPLGGGARERGPRPSNIDTSSSWSREPARRAYDDSGYGHSHTQSSNSLAPSPASLSPVHSPAYSSGNMSKSSSASSGLSLTRSGSSASDSSLDSPSSAASSNARMPFFEKYNKTYGESATPSPSAMSSSFSSRSLAALERAQPETSSTREFSASPQSMKSVLGQRSVARADGRVKEPRAAGLYERRPPTDRSRSEDVLSKPSKGKPSALNLDNENIGRAFLEDSPYIPDTLPYQRNTGLSYRAEPSQSNKILAADALDSLLEDLSIETKETSRRTRGSLEAYYFDDGASEDEDDLLPTPRASAAAPKSDYGPPRAQFMRPPSPARTAHSAPEAGRMPRRASTPCRTCGKQISMNDSVERDGGRFCGECYAERYLPKCRKCRLPIKGSAISSGDGKIKGKFHVDCFNCFSCSAPFPNKQCHVWDERPYCQHHYHELAGSLCTNCGTGIEGHCVTLDADLGGRRFHPSCFTCSDSSCSLMLDEYHYVVDGKPYCQRHSERRGKGRADKRKTLVRPAFGRR